MITNEMLQKLTIGTVIRTNVPKRKWAYMSYKNRNGMQDQLFRLESVYTDAIDWFVAGISIRGQKRYLKLIEKEPRLSIEFNGGFASFYGKRELDGIVRYCFNGKSGKGFYYVRSINVSDVNLLLGVDVEPPNRWYTFKEDDYSPESFVKHRGARLDSRVRHLAYYYSKEELPKSLETDIVFTNKTYWLASKSIFVEKDCARFGLGEVTKDGYVNMGHNLFKSNGECLGKQNTAYIRMVVFVAPKLFDLVKQEDGAFKLVVS